MNTRKVYECLVFLITEYNQDDLNNSINFKARFIQKSLVYEYNDFYYIDLRTGKKYLSDTSLSLGHCQVGEYYIPSATLKPIKTLIDLKRTHMTKNGIIKTYDKQRIKRLSKQLKRF